jgi:hypothetical protein
MLTRREDTAKKVVVGTAKKMRGLFGLGKRRYRIFVGGFRLIQPIGGDIL